MAIRENRSNLEFIQWGYVVYNDVPIGTPTVFSDIDTFCNKDQKRTWKRKKC